MKLRTYWNTFVFSIFFLQLIMVSAAHAANKIMPLGDSITDASGIFDETAYRRTLYLLLTEAGYDTDFVGSLATGIPDDFDKDHEGHPGWRDDEIVNGRIGDDPDEGQLSDWLVAFQPQIVLLHIGTNNVEPSPDDVEAILDAIDAYSPDVWVVMALIINRNCSVEAPLCPVFAQNTTDFNDNIEAMAQNRIDLGGDKIIIIDMELGANIDYRLQPVGDMVDNLHPWVTGYDKMADHWYDFGLMNILPVAYAGGPVQNVDEFSLVTLDASGSSDPKSPAWTSGTFTYQWVQTAGSPVVVLSDAQAAQPTFDAPDAGPTEKTLTFTLTITDEDGLESTDTVNVVVQKIQPQANAGLDQAVSNPAVVTLNASGSVGVGLTYQWRQTAGTAVSLSGADAVQATFNASQVGTGGGTVTFELTVTDDDNVSSTDTVDIVVKALPRADAGPDQNVNELVSVTLDASGSAGAGILSYAWEQTDGTPVALSGNQTAQPTFTAPDIDPGTEILTFKLTVTDEDNLQSADTVNIVVNNHTPVDSGGGGGGGGCFITTAVNRSAMTLNTGLPNPRYEHIAKSTMAIALVFVFIGSCVAITLGKSRKRWQKL